MAITTKADFVAASIVNGGQSVILAALYRPTINDLAQMEDLCDAIWNLVQRHSESPIWIAGDINLPDIDWSTLSVSSHQYAIALNETYLQLLAATGMEQLVDFPTRGRNTLDIVMTNRPSLTNRCESLPPLSDHHLVFVDVSIKATRRKPVKRKILLWRRVCFDTVRQRAATLSGAIGILPLLQLKSLPTNFKVAYSK